MEHTMKKIILTTAFALAASFGSITQAADYVIDTKGAHAFINFKIKHLGYSWLTGRFNDFEGKFSYDASGKIKPAIEVSIKTASVDSNHAERDKHLRGNDFLNVEKFPTASFKSTKIDVNNLDNAMVTGDFTLHGVTKSISFPVHKIGEGNDPWGGYRAGFSGLTSIKLADYGIMYNLGPASTHVDLELHIEGIRQ